MIRLNYFSVSQNTLKQQETCCSSLKININYALDLKKYISRFTASGVAGETKLACTESTLAGWLAEYRTEN
jgi:hypothetical protein